MDWIERWLGMRPDGGDGTLEMLLLAVALLLPVMVRVLRAGRARLGRPRSTEAG